MLVAASYFFVSSYFQSDPIKADRVWTLLQDSPDPRLRLLRSYLIHRFARAGWRTFATTEAYAIARALRASE